MDSYALGQTVYWRGGIDKQLHKGTITKLPGASEMHPECYLVETFEMHTSRVTYFDWFGEATVDVQTMRLPGLWMKGPFITLPEIGVTE